MARSLYTLPTDEVGAAATVTLNTATADANYPVTKVQTTNPADNFLTSSSATIVNIDWDHGSAVDVQIASLHHHNIPAGTVCNWYRGATQGATTLTAPFTIGTYPNPGLPLPVGIDLTSASGYSGAGFRWTRLNIPSLAQKVGVGSALLWNIKRQDLHNVTVPFQPTERQTSRTFPTAYEVKQSYRLGIRLRSMAATILTRALDYPIYLSLFRATQGDVQAFLYWLDVTTSDAWLARFGSDITNVSFTTYSNPVQIVIEEKGCGLALPTV